VGAALALGLLALRAAELGTGPRAAVAPGVLVGGAALAAFSFVARRARFALTVGLIVIAGGALGPQRRFTEQRRSFYGVHRIARGERLVRLMHGSTWHGAQNVDPARRLEPLGYYHRGSPVGEVLAALAPLPRPRRVGVVGLGAGTLAAYGRPGESWTFFEIDPVVVEIARGSGHFSYLAGSAARVDVVVADGRKGLERTARGSFDVIVLDAFSSDSVPAHLMTEEAVRLAFDKLGPGGLLLVHTSNRYLRLARVLGAVAPRLGLQAWVGWQSPDAAGAAEGRNASEWVVLARGPADLPRVSHPEIFRLLPPGDPADAWTDDHASLLGLLKLR
jgi:SAM-dependent methyltransferase